MTNHVTRRFVFTPRRAVLSAQKMIRPTLVAFAALCVVKSNAALTAEGISNIRLLHVVFRHGERAPADTYPNDVYTNYSFPPYGWGQLTTVGRENQYKIGEFLRARYEPFLGNIYHPDIVAVETTGVDRTIMSAQLQMAGMWPPVDEQRWNKYLSWQPISMKIDPVDNDKLLLVRIPCAQYSMEREAVLNSIKDELLPYKDVMDYLERNSGKMIRNAEDVNDLYSTLNAEATYGVALPRWLEGVFPEGMEYLAAYSFVIDVKTPLMKRLKGGPLLNKILKDSKAAASQTLKPERRKLYMYGGHDSTIVNLLATLGVWETQIPGFGIMAILEVHEDPQTHEYGLKVFLRNSTVTAEPIPLKIPDCGFWCPLQQVEQLYADLLPSNITAECKSNDPNYVPPPPSGP